MSGRFCVLTTGRAGSTSLMRAIAALPGVLVPSAVLPCVDEELLHPERGAVYRRRLARRLGRPVAAGEDDLVAAFFECAAGARHAGFKSMPNRHADLAGFTAREDIRFVVLEREDLASTVASFVLAEETGSWRRAGGEQDSRWRFTAGARPRVDQYLHYLCRARHRLASVRDAIRIRYEDLCRPGFACPALDRHFGAPVRLPEPRPPTRAATYVANWPEFERYVAEEAARFRAVLEASEAGGDWEVR